MYISGFELKSASLLAGIMPSSTSCSSLFLGMSQIFAMNDHFVNITYINTKKYWGKVCLENKHELKQTWACQNFSYQSIGIELTKIIPIEGENHGAWR